MLATLCLIWLALVSFLNGLESYPPLVDLDMSMYHANGTVRVINVLIYPGDDVIAATQAVCRELGVTTLYRRCECDMLLAVLIELHCIPSFRGSDFTISWPLSEEELAARSVAADGEGSVPSRRSFEVKPSDDFGVVLPSLFAAYHMSLYGVPEDAGMVVPEWPEQQYSVLFHLWGNMFKHFIRGFDDARCLDGDVDEKCGGGEGTDVNPFASTPVPITPYVQKAEELLLDPALSITLFVPDGLGIGNVLKGYLTFLSLHSDSKIEINTKTLLGNYRGILHENHLYTGPQSEVRTEFVFTYRLLLLRSEEHLVSPGGRFSDLRTTADAARALNFPENARLMPLFAPNVSIDNIFRRAALPGPVVHRILSAVRRVTFTQMVTDLADAATDSLIHPSLGISVRCWRGAHEASASFADIDNFDANQREKYSQDKYERLIASVVADNDVGSILITFDSPSLWTQYQPFLQRLSEQHNVEVVLHFLENTEFLQLDLLQQAAVQMLALSKTSFLIGDDRSTFLEAVFWFGECRQTVFHPYL